MLDTRLCTSQSNINHPGRVILLTNFKKILKSQDVM